MKEIKKLEKAIIKTEQIVLTTYPYDDPSPIPEFGRLYPYNRFDGYTDQSTEQPWEMIVMENNYIKIWINPKVGGKIWGAIEKSTGKEFIYFNNSVKFRDVAMRGPWTSGGMEINMGIIGHTPSCSAPVDYKMIENPDGSVSCFIGATDWPSRTEWRVEINLKKDAAHFSTKSWWHNNSCMPQSYYQWNNVGIKAAGNLEYIYPGNKRLGHDGASQHWPEDEQNRKISFYDQNDHGEYKSYHVFGSYSDFWGCYWHDDQFGMGHSAAYDDKPGKKIWIWGLSPYGMIWEDLLTDHDGQYTEVQSGRLFNQSIATSSKTPFKHRSFLPYSYDTWEEHWFPVKNIGGLTYSSRQLSFYLPIQVDAPQINLCAIEHINHTLILYHNQEEILRKEIHLEPMQTCNLALPMSVQAEHLTIMLNEDIIFNGPEQNYPLKRPSKIDRAYNFNSAQALYIQAKEWERQRFFELSVKHYQLCLKKDPFFIEALSGLAGLYFKQMRFSDALNLLATALSVDTYHPETNYLYGLVNDRLNNYSDAKDGFSIASQSVEYRMPAYNELAKMLLRAGQIDQAEKYILKARHFQPENLQTIYFDIVVNRIKGRTAAAREGISSLLKRDPINYLANFELDLLNRDSVRPITISELPYETYIELAAFYTNIHLYAEAILILSNSPDYAMVHLWKAWLYNLSGAPDDAQVALKLAAASKPDFVFPHREEDVHVLNWAVNEHTDWKFKYYLALAYIQNLKKQEALSLLNNCFEEPSFYPFYILRANLRRELGYPGRLGDLQNAHDQAPNEWRPILNLCRYYLEKEDWTAALFIVEQGYHQYPDNYYLGLQLAKCLMHTKQLDEAISLMNNMTVLPNEGASEGRNSWRESHLLSAFNAIEAGDFDQVLKHINLARTWPENMGIGKPYHVDERLEDFIQLTCTATGNSAQREGLLKHITHYRLEHKQTPYSSLDLLGILLLRATENDKEADKILERWKKLEPDTLALRWAIAFLDGNQQEIDRLSKEKPLIKEAFPYEILFEDRSFNFIKKLYELGLLNKSIHLVNNELTNNLD
jgi:tetratricopeptide (TPR) repeat protein